jgi:hypothetical protein
MSEHKDEKRLDDALRQAIDGNRPAFDAEAWKQKYAAAYETLVSRSKGTAAGGPGIGRTVRLAVRRLALAAVILIGVAVLLPQLPGRHEPDPVVPRAAVAGPARMVSMMSLRAAYLKGGQEGLGVQLDKALKHLGPRPNGLSMRDSFEDSDG